MSIKIRKGDLVEVISGESKGKRGKILEIIKEKHRVRAIVEGVNLAKKHKRTQKANQPGGIIDLPNPLDISKLSLVCPKCGKLTKVKRDLVEGKRIRICKLCEEIID